MKDHQSMTAMTKNSSAMSTTSSQRWHRLLLFFFFFTAFSLNSVSSSLTQFPNYHDHCSSTVPGLPHNKVRHPKFPIARSHDGYYTGGNPVLNPNPNPVEFASIFSNSLSLRTLAVFDTDIPGLFQFKGRLTFQNANKYDSMKDLSGTSRSYYYSSGMISYSTSSQRSSISFEMEGFWSKSTGKLCMVGSASAFTEEANMLTLSAVLKLDNLRNSASITSLITGTLESLSSSNDPAYFGPISMLILPRANYKYDSVSESDRKGCSGGGEIPRGLSLSSLPKGTFCSIASSWLGRRFNLRYASECNSAKSCNPFVASIGYVPRVMSLHEIECSEETEKMRVLVEFSNSSYADYYPSFKPETTLVGEGSWDESKHQLCIVGCPFLNFNKSLADAHVGDCSTRLSFRFPAIWSIKNAANIVGQIWTNKTLKESDYFDRIMLRSSRNDMVGVPDLKYEYTKIDTAMKLCPKSEKPAKPNGKRYPSGHSDVLRREFDISVKSSRGKIAWGKSVPLSYGDQFYYSASFEGSVEPANSSSRGSVNISYSIGLYSTSGISPFNSTSSTSYEMLEILAEGTYDDETGSMCMVGCRNLGSEDQIPRVGYWDCEILVKFHFPPFNSKKAGYIKGSISSTREKSHPHYFERLDLSSTAFYEDEFSIWRMDMEIILALVSSTLSCVFVVLQIFHVNRHPDVLSFISFFMLSILTFGQLTPLVLNFEALFLINPRRNMWLESKRWVEGTEVIVRMTGMVAFLLQFRLLQKTWSTKWSSGNQKGTWVVEKKALVVALPLYVTGALIAVAVNWWNREDNGPVSAPITYRPDHSLWEDLQSYAGLVLDGFLLPQILLNMFWNSRERALSCSFYIGNTFVRFLPHAYDLYRAHNYARSYAGTYMYANPSTNYYSTAWDVSIPLGGLVFALTVYLQQRFGGRCIFPRSLREMEGYEKVPAISEA